MKEIKTLFNKFELDETKSDEIRSNLISKRSASRVWLIPVVAVAAAMVMIMVIPAARETVVNAAERILLLFHLDAANGDVIEWKIDPDTGETQQDMCFSTVNRVELARVKDGRLYLVLGEEWTDITDKCSATNYYRQEIVHEGGYKEVIVIGGVPETHKYGWVVWFYDSEGICTISHRDISYSSPKKYPDCEEEDFEWVKRAEEAEGFDFHGF